MTVLSEKRKTGRTDYDRIRIRTEKMAGAPGFEPGNDGIKIR